MQLESLYIFIYSSIHLIKLLTKNENCNLIDPSVLVCDWRISQTCNRCTSSSSTEEVIDRHQSDCGGVALRGCGELLAEALLPPAASVRSDVQQPLDVLQAALQGLQASPGLR